MSQELAELCGRYNATVLSTFDSRYGLVVEVATTSERLVMRSSPDPDAAAQAEVSRSLAHLGVGPEIREVIEAPSGVWTVAVRVLPGDTLKNRVVPIEALATVLRPMHKRPAPPGLPSLAAWLEERLHDEKPIDLPIGRTLAPAADRQHAIRLLADLSTSTGHQLCHGDASSKNILLGHAGKLFLIDPRGVSGDLAYDVAVAAWKTAGSEPAGRRAAELSSLLDIDAPRVSAWLDIAQAARV
ncbi:phosphotransferase [Actinomadura sp. NEAU-AAG7]|uniref:phosphotransferase n=1 Tax=Actinomadura sp. NEAU-AAG7 TaxID=2839640 RepID=UPI001BE3FEB2|nr:phosphotransferase [Actinomadura sp. NEAU-AAG7]MBT2210324.1 phosphotransferase [Actinomadura sp. NEAU-AAG7]